MRRSIRIGLFLFATWAGASVVAIAQDTGAKTSGNWEDSTIWTGGAVPGSSNNVYIGSTYPTGAASVATVSLTANESASNVYLGNGGGTLGTLDLGGHTLAIANDLLIAEAGGTGVLNENGGSFTASSVIVDNGNSLTLGTKDVTSYLNVGVESSAVTTMSGNVTGTIYINNGGTLTAGADLNLSSTLGVQESGSSLNMQGHSLTATTFDAGYYGSSAVSVTNLGEVTLTNLNVGFATSLTLHGGDMVSNEISLSNRAILTVDEANSQGLTFFGTLSNSLSISGSPYSSAMDLVFTSTTPNNWVFRWQDPASNLNWVSTLDAMIADHQINITTLPGQTYQVINKPDGYTYILGIGGAAVPEPSTLVLASLGLAGVVLATARRRRQAPTPSKSRRA